MTFTGACPLIDCEAAGAIARAGRTANRRGTIAILARNSARAPSYPRPMTSRCRRRLVALVDAARPCRPAALPAGARARIAAALRGWFEDAGLRRGRDAGAAGLARQRGPSARLRDRAAWRAGRRARPLYLHTSPEFACKKLLAAGEPRIFTFARVFRNRERGAAAPSRIHHAGMVSRGRALRGADGGLRGAAARSPPRRRARGAGAGAGRSCDPVRRARAADASPRPSRAMPASTCWRRSTDAASPTATRWRQAARPSACASAADDTWSDIFSRDPGRARSSRSSGIGRADDPRSTIPAAEAALARPQRRRPARRRAVRALCLRRRARQRLRRTDRCRRAAPALRGRDGREAARSMASAIRSTRISSPRWRRCRRRAASRWASTGW